jgi:hypothetical protein
VEFSKIFTGLENLDDNKYIIGALENIKDNERS